MRRGTGRFETGSCAHGSDGFLQKCDKCVFVCVCMFLCVYLHSCVCVCVYLYVFFFFCRHGYIGVGVCVSLCVLESVCA